MNGNKARRSLRCVQVCYCLGATGRSFVIGFGTGCPNNPHHRDSALTLEQSGNWEIFNDSSIPNANLLTGALVGGPSIDDEYDDVRSNYQKNEVALDYNAALLIGTVQCMLALEPSAAAAPLPPPAVLPRAWLPVRPPFSGTEWQLATYDTDELFYKVRMPI